MKKYIFLLSICICFSTISIGQTASKNLENCKYVMSIKPDGDILIHISTFTLTTLNDIQKNELKSIIFDKSKTTYKIEFDQNQQIHIYHLSDVSLQYFKELFFTLNYFVDFVDQTTIESL